MSRMIVVLLILTAVASSLRAARRVTAAQFENAVAAFRAKSDAEAAFLVADMQLTERLGEARLARLNAMLTGEKSRQALTAVADASEFQPPPLEEIPATAVPDLAAQKRIMGLVAGYVSKAIPKLPNFIATRATDFFEDTPLLVEPAASIPYQPLHLVGHSSSTVLFRDGREVEEPMSKLARKSKQPRGLQSWGEFGPILATILVDAAQNTLAFSRWESGPAGLEAVFRYNVPQPRSHYDVNYCCVVNEAASAVANTSPFHEIVGYHGDMAVDPEKGSILRLSVIAELKAGSPVTRADILVNYGPVTITGQTYLCPVKSVSITTAQMVQLDPVLGYPLARQMQPLKTMLNHVTFEQYHVFRSESRVLTAESGAGGAAAGSEMGNAAHESPAAKGQPDEPKASDQPNANAAPSATETSVVADTAAAHGASADAAIAQPAAAAPASAEPEPPEFTIGDTADVLNAPEQSQPPAAASGFRLRTTTRLVDVGLVAYDNKGRPVTDLKQSDFEIYDNGRRQEIKYFSQASQDVAPASPAQPGNSGANGPPEPVYSNRQLEPAIQPRGPASGSHATILLIDSANLSWSDFQYAREEMLRFLKGLPAGEPVGLYVLRSFGFEILLESTPDHSLVAATLSRWMPSAQDLQRAQEAEQRNRQHIDWVAHTSDLVNLNGNDGKDPEQSFSGTGRVEASKHGADPQLRSMGANPQRDALVWLEMVARHLAMIPGHKSLVWVSCDNVLANWQSQSASREEKGPNLLDPLNLRAREALNDSHVSIYPLDASQLEAGVITADLQNRLVQVKIPSPADPPPPPPDPNGRYAAQMHQDLRGTMPEFRELAEATGGRALRRAGDIAAELNGIAEDGRAAYLLSFNPDSPADDKYHVITVKLTGRRNLTLRYRTGYLYEKESATLKERFQKAAWQPRDLNEIALTATPEGAGKDAALKLNIAATDLEMAQAGGHWTDTLDIFLIARNDAEFRAKFSGRTLGLRLLPATYQKVLREGIVVEQPLPAGSDAGSLRIVVVDRNSGRIGSLTLPNAIHQEPFGNNR